MNSSSETGSQTPQDLLNDLRSLVAEAEKMIGSSASEHTDETVGRLRARLDAAQERLGDLYKNARQKVVAGAHHTDETIRANPYQSIAVAAGVGLLIGLLVGRRSN